MKYIIGLILITVLGVLAYLFIWTPLQTTEMDDTLPTSTAQPTAEPETTSEATPTEPADTEPEVRVYERVALSDTPLHPASGYVRLFTEGDQTFLRYEDFETINGPDLFVYLATDEDATEFVNLGRLKATKGNVNYEIPAEVDLSVYSHALVWCRAFGVLFNSADLSTTL